MNEKMCNLTIKVEKLDGCSTIIVSNTKIVIYPKKISTENDEYILDVVPHERLSLTIIMFYGTKPDSVFSICDIKKDNCVLGKIKYLFNCGDRYNLSKLTVIALIKKDASIKIVPDKTNLNVYEKTVLSVHSYNNVKILNESKSNWYSKKQKRNFFSIIVLRKIIPLTFLLFFLVLYESKNIKYWDSYEVTVGSHNFVWTAIMIVLTIVLMIFVLTKDSKKYNEIT